MVEKSQTWRDLLGEIISNPQDRQRIAAHMEINPATLMRWTRSKARPRVDSLLHLQEAIPAQYQARLSTLVAEEYPQLAPRQEEAVTRAGRVIPSAFYARTLNTYTSTPENIRIEAVRTMLLQQIVAHLAPAQHQLLVVSLAQCMPPLQGKRWIRSLRLIAGRGTLLWKTFIENQVIFLGAESPVGRALRGGYLLEQVDIQEMEWLNACYKVSQMGSFVASPILHASKAAGCLYLFSPDPHFFTLDNLPLIQAYTDLFVLAFDPRAFFELDEIVLGVMPSPEEQRSVLAQFQSRVTQLLLQDNTHQLTRPRAESLVWQELEQELLHWG